MGLWLKQSTAVDFLAGPFIDDGDGKTPETGLTITQTEVRLSKNGGNMAQKNEATALVHDELGMYVCKLDATDTNTLGTLQVTIWESGALLVYHEFMVVTANVYDTLCSTDKLEVDLTQMGGVAQSATDLKDFADAGYDPATDKVTGVKLCDQTTLVDSVTLCDQTTLVDGVTLCDQTTLVDGVTLCDHTTLVDTTTTNTDMVDVSDLATILTDTNELQTDLTNGGRLDLLIDAIKAKTDNLPADPADDSDIDAQLATIAGYIDAEIAAIKAVTDTLSLAAIADAVHDEVTEGTTTLRQAIRLLLSHHTGKSSGGGTNTLVYRDIGDSKDRLTYTVDADGNRSAVVRDGA